MNNKQLGYIGEKIAKFYLQINKYQILKCNYYCKFGEIDIIAKKDNYIHFVEVKTRTNRFIEAREAINFQKQKHIKKSAQYFIYKNNIKNYGITFDAIEVYIEKNSVVINLIEQIIES